MNELITSILVIGAEVGVVIGILFLVVMTVIILKHKKETDIAARFTQEFKESSKERRKHLEKSLSDAFKLDDAESENCAAVILKNERTICSNVLRIFHGKDKSLILKLQDDLASLNGAYYEMANRNTKQEVTNDEDDNAEDENVVNRMQSELNVIRQENVRLKEDLKKSLESVDYLQAQYTELFDKANK